MVPITYWLSLEAPVSVISICLPSIFSFVKKGIQHGPYSLLTSKDIHSVQLSEQESATRAHHGEGPRGIRGRETSVERLCQIDEANQYSASAFKSPSLTSSQKTREHYAMDEIRVQKDMDVSVQH